MATTLRSVLENTVGMLENDDLATWTVVDLVRYANDGQIDMCNRRPDLFSHYVDMPLVAGWRQRIPADGVKLLDVHANAVGSKRACTLVQRSMLDAQLRGWRSLEPVLEVDHYLFDEREPARFDVFPPAAVGASLSLEYARRPAAMAVPAPDTPLSAVAGNVNVPDEMSVALQHYIAFRCYAEGSEDGNAQAAKNHISIYADILGVEIQATRAVAPSNSPK